MLTNRDIKVISSIGKHKALSKEQIIALHFPSYQTFRRRMRKELEGKFLSNPFGFYYNQEYVQMYRLTKKGTKLYKKKNNIKKYYKPTWSENYIPHLIETNQVIIDLNEIIKDFQLEYTPSKLSKVQLDALLTLNNNQKISLEIDRGTENKKEIIKQFKNYQQEYKKYNLSRYYAVVSNRNEKVKDWCFKVADLNLDILPFFINKKQLKVFKNKIKELIF